MLVVDDQPDVLRVYARALEADGCDVMTAASAQAAIDLISAAPPDAMLLDLNMPYVNGLGLLYRLREVDAELPVAIVTGLALDETRVQEIRDLNAALAYKPLSVEEIQGVARRLLARDP